MGAVANSNEMMMGYAFPSKGLLGFWAQDEGSGLTAFDSASSNNASLTSSVLWDSSGVNGQSCLAADGSNYANLPSAANWIGLSGNDFTVAGWYYKSSAEGGKTTRMLYINASVNSGTPSFNRGILLEVLDNGNVSFRVVFGSTTSAYGTDGGRWLPGLTPKDDEWNLIVCHRSASQAKATLVNSDGTATATLSGSLGSVSFQTLSSGIHRYIDAATSNISPSSGGKTCLTGIWEGVSDEDFVKALWNGGKGSRP